MSPGIGGAELALPAVHAELVEQRDGRGGVQFFQRDLRRRRPESGEIRDPFAGGHHAETRIARGQALEEGGEAGISEAAFDLQPARRVLQRLDAVEDEKGPLLPD